MYPRLIAAEHKTAYDRESVKSGLTALDSLLGTGLAKGTSTLVLGPAGTGKSTLACQFAMNAGAQGVKTALFLFDESPETLFERTTSLGMDLSGLAQQGVLQLRQVDPAELTPGEFAATVRELVEKSDVKLVVIDSLNGYLNAMPSERHLTLHLHELLTYLGQQGVTTMLLMAQHGLVGSTNVPVDASYLADTIILMRYFELRGEVRQAISVIKKRTGKHERTIREMRFGPTGLTIGEPLRDFQGVLTGVPSLLNLEQAGRRSYDGIVE